MFSLKLYFAALWGTFIMKSIWLATAAIILVVSQSQAGEQYSINDALRQAIQTHPGVGEASASRRELGSGKIRPKWHWSSAGNRLDRTRNCTRAMAKSQRAISGCPTTGVGG